MAPPEGLPPTDGIAAYGATTDTVSGNDGDAIPSLARASSDFFFNHEFGQDNPGKLEDFYEVNFPVQLGAGSFGSVYPAKCRKTAFERAVKSMEWKSVKNPARFELEISIAKKLDHPNIVRLFETFRDARKLYIVMEMCTGKELFDHIVDDAPNGFTEAKAATYIRQMLGALTYLHSNKFAHRDIKPENFLLSSKEPGASLKLIDFGLACRIDENPMSTKVGTAFYVAPQVLEGCYNEKCDVWSSGVISFILLCGFPPFSGSDDAQTLRQVRKGTFLFKSPEWDNISEGAKGLISQQLTFDQMQRPSAQSLLNHAWLECKVTSEQATLGENFVRKLESFRAKGRLRKVALAAIAQNLPDKRIDALQKTFLSLDKNGDGSLSFEEIKDGLVSQGLSVPKALDDILRNVDYNGSGSLDYTEFLAATIDQRHYRQRDICWAAFRTFDLDGDGKITREELQKVLNSGNVEKTLGPEKVARMIEDFDKDGDGCIDFEEFCTMLVPPEVGKRRRILGKQLSTSQSPSAKRSRFSSNHSGDSSK